jgi:hypothetical protein
MKWLTWSLMGALYACAVPSSSFAFNLSGAAHDQVNSDATGEIDNAGDLSLQTAGYELTMSLGSLTVGEHDNAEVTILLQNSGDVFTTAVGGSCTVFINPHDDSNGSDVSGLFFCTGLMTSTQLQADLTGGQFVTEINDSANNPGSLGPPGP